MDSKKVIIYGAGGFGREVAWLIQSCNQLGGNYQICCFIDDTPSKHGTEINNIPVKTFANALKYAASAGLVISIADPNHRQTIAEKIEKSCFNFATFIHPKVEMSDWVEVGYGSVICAGNILTTNILIGQHVHINLGCTIGHDVIIDNFSTLAPGVHVSGRVHIGKRVYIGTGAVINDGKINNPLIIEDDVTIGAGACVTKSLKSNKTYVGVPAKPKSM